MPCFLALVVLLHTFSDFSKVIAAARGNNDTLAFLRVMLELIA